MKRTMTNSSANYYQSRNSIRQVQSQYNPLEKSKTLSYESSALLNEIFNLLPENQNQNFFSTSKISNSVPMSVPTYIQNEEIYNFLKKLDEKENNNTLQKEQSEKAILQSKEQQISLLQQQLQQQQLKQEQLKQEQLKQEQLQQQQIQQQQLQQLQFKQEQQKIQNAKKVEKIQEKVPLRSTLDQSKNSNEEEELELHKENQKRQKKLEKKLINLIKKSQQLLSTETNQIIKDSLCISSLQMLRVQQILDSNESNQDEYLEQKFGDGADKLEIASKQPNKKIIEEKILCTQCYNYIEMKKIDFHWKNCQKIDNQIFAEKIEHIKKINEFLKQTTNKIQDSLQKINQNKFELKEIERTIFLVLENLDQSINCNLDFIELNILLLDLGNLTEKLLYYDLQPLYKIISFANRSKIVIKEKAMLLQFVTLKNQYKIAKTQQTLLQQQKCSGEQTKISSEIQSESQNQFDAYALKSQLTSNISDCKQIQNIQVIEQPKLQAAPLLASVSNQQNKSMQSNSIQQNSKQSFQNNQQIPSQQFLKSKNQSLINQQCFSKKENLQEEDQMSQLAQKFLNQKIQNKQCYFNDDLSYQQEQEDASSGQEQELEFSLHEYKIPTQVNKPQQSELKLAQQATFDDFNDIFQFKQIQDQMLQAHNEEFGDEDEDNERSDCQSIQSQNFAEKIQQFKNLSHPYSLDIKTNNQYDFNQQGLLNQFL